MENVNPSGPKPTGKEGKHIREWRLARASLRNEASTRRTPQEQLKRLDEQGFRAERERTRLQTKIASGTSVSVVKEQAPTNVPVVQEEKPKRPRRDRGRRSRPKESNNAK